MMCEACTRGDHANCGMQTWCDCENERDGDHDAAPDFYADEEEDAVDDDGEPNYMGGEWTDDSYFWD